MENKYKYSGKIDKLETFLRLRKSLNSQGKGGYRTSQYLGEAIDMHNSGLGPGDIASKLSESTGKKITRQQVISWFERIEHKPNEDTKKNRCCGGYKLLDKAFYIDIISESFSTGKSLWKVVQDKYSGIVSYADNTTEDISSKFIFNNIVAKADEEYLDKE